MEAYLQDSQIDIETTEYLRRIYKYYLCGEFRFCCVVCSNSHFFVVSLMFNVTDPKKEIFTNVRVYDSLKYVNKGHAAKTIPFTTGDTAAKFLLTLQKFLSTFVFHNAANNDVLLNDEHYIMKKAKCVSCPHQQNCYDCSLFAIGMLLHLILDLPVDDTIFHQDDIIAMQKQLQAYY
jgi:Ulp1 family protease